MFAELMFILKAHNQYCQYVNINLPYVLLYLCHFLLPSTLQYYPLTNSGGFRWRFQ